MTTAGSTAPSCAPTGHRRSGGWRAWAADHAYTLAVVALTIAAFALRLVHVGDDLLGDELYTYDDIHGRNLRGVLDHLRTGGTEDNPPLFFLAAWVSAKLGADTVLIRLPSLAAGTATVPAVYLLGLRTLGRRAGLAAAGLVTVSPFAVYYGTEARAYALLMLLAALSSLFLVEATRGGRTRWWVGYALATCAMLYTHYTGVLIVAAHLAWVAAYRREGLRSAATAVTAALAGYLPWIGTELGGSPHIEFAPIGPLTVDALSVHLMRLLVGNPYRNAATVPGTGIGVLLAVLVGGCLAALAVRSVSGSRNDERTAAVVLLVLLAAVPVAGVLAYSIARSNIFLARNLGSALPAFAVLSGAALTSLGRRFGVVAATLAVGLLGVGTVRSLGEDVRGSSGPEVARYVERSATARDAVLAVSLFGAGGPVELGPAIYFSHAPENFFTSGSGEADAWRYAAASGGRVFVIYRGPGFRHEDRAGPGRCFDETSIRRWSATIVATYALARGDPPCRVDALFTSRIGFVGFGPEEHAHADETWRWCVRPHCLIAVVNPSPSTRRVVASGLLATPGPRAELVSLRIGDRSTTLRATADGDRFDRTIVVAPHSVAGLELTVHGPGVHALGDARTLYMKLLRFHTGPAPR